MHIISLKTCSLVSSIWIIYWFETWNFELVRCAPLHSFQLNHNLLISDLASLLYCQLLSNPCVIIYLYTLTETCTEWHIQEHMSHTLSRNMLVFSGPAQYYFLFHFMTWTKQNTPVSVWQHKYQSIYNCCNSYMILPDLLPFTSDCNRSIFRYLFTTYLAPHDQEWWWLAFAFASLTSGFGKDCSPFQLLRILWTSSV